VGTNFHFANKSMQTRRLSHGLLTRTFIVTQGQDTGLREGASRVFVGSVLVMGLQTNGYRRPVSRAQRVFM
jgi:hypothetical protein